MQPASENDGAHRLVRSELTGRRPGSGTWDSVSACLAHDHRVLDAILTDVDTFTRKGELCVAAKYLAHFRARIATHMDLEEAILFPAYELATGCTGPSTVMRREHAEIRRLLEALGDSLAGGNAANAPFLLDVLARFLDGHDEKEERVIYPAVDANVGACELGVLVRRIETFIELGCE